MCSVITQLSPGIIGIGLSLSEVTGFYFRIFLSEQFVDFTRQLTGDILAGSRRELLVEPELCVILSSVEISILFWVP